MYNFVDKGECVDKRVFCVLFRMKIEICLSEYQPGKSLYTTVRELVENALDSAESIAELPLVEVTM